MKVGVQIQQQGSDIASLLAAATRLDEAGADSLWVTDHFFPVYGDRDGTSFECYTLLAALAVTTQRATIGALVTSIAYRKPDLLADMARTIDHLSGGRFVLGLGSGWFERDYDEYGFEFGTAGERLRALEAGIATIRRRLSLLNPAPVGALPILIGGSGPKVTLRIVAEHADAWNAFGPADDWAALNRILDEWCERVGRDPDAIERTVALNSSQLASWRDFAAAGATHLIVMSAHPHALDPVERLLSEVRSQ